MPNLAHESYPYKVVTNKYLQIRVSLTWVRVQVARTVIPSINFPSSSTFIEPGNPVLKKSYTIVPDVDNTVTNNSQTNRNGPHNVKLVECSELIKFMQVISNNHCLHELENFVDMIGNTYYV